jgi:two-component system, cell cycle sensor histidine kinase and response regulator CckA
MGKPRILVVDDERVVVEVLGSLLDDPDREILTADCAAKALEHARAGEISVALVDKNLGADSGLALARQLKQVQPELEVILITGYASIESAIEAVQIGAFDYLTKPIADFSALSFKVQSAVEKSQLRRSQRALTERLMDYEVRHRRLIDAAPEAIVLYEGAGGAVVEANEAAVKLYGYSPQELLHASAADLRGGAPEGVPGPAPVLQRHRRKDGSEFTAEVTFTDFQQQGRTLRVQSARDVSEREQGEARRRELEERQRAAQKMEAMGRMAGGVAHDFGNLMAVIAAHAESLTAALGPGHRLVAEVEGIAQAAQRGRALTRQLLLFSRRAPHETAVSDIGAVIREAHRLLPRLVGENILVSTEVPQALWRSRTNPDQLREVILALAMNARDAMPEGGRLAVRATNLALEAPARLRGGELPEGRYVRITVADTGHGMSEEVLRRLFEPFFTTKPARKGSGLGLATVYGIAGASGGGVDVASSPGEGTQVSVYLPAADGAVALPDAGSAGAPARGKGERILLVEDEEGLRVMVRRMLTAHGYEVVDAPDAEKGLRAAEGRSVDLLLTDVVLPSLDGPSLAQKLLAIQPALRVLYISGYPAADHELPSPEPLIQKPFAPAALLGAVRTVLDRQLPPIQDGRSSHSASRAGTAGEKR